MTTQFLVEELSQIMRESMPAPVIEITPQGELFSREAMELARFYQRASRVQQSALDAMVKAMGPRA